MNLFKATALFLVIAVFNPFCCCLQLFANEAPIETPPMQMDHGCCVKESNSSHDKADSHDSGNCPHMIEKSSQISQSADHLDLQAKLTFSIESLGPIATLAEQSLESSVLPVSKISQPLPPSTPVSQAYCVRLL